MTWIDDATEGWVEVEGCPVRYLTYGRAEGRPLVLVHGGAAHAGWWLHVVPQLALRRRVVVIELSGHGDSGKRPDYSPELWAQDGAAILREVGVPDADLVGHSMGGLASIYITAAAPELVRTLILIDSPLQKVTPLAQAPAARQVRYFDSAENAVARFRLLPRETFADSKTLEEVAAIGLYRDAEGWRWKFDPATRQRFTNEGIEQALRGVRCPIGFLYGSHSELANESSADYIAGVVGRPVPRAAVPNAYHHVPIDAPIATADGIEQLLVLLENQAETSATATLPRLPG